MRERVEAAGGRLSLETGPEGHGTVLEVVLSTTIKVLLADDQALVRGALAALLALEPDLEVVAEVGRGDEVVDAARPQAPTSACSTSRCRASTASRPPPPCATRCPACAR